MTPHPLPPLLLDANLALFKGERGEVLRLLRQYERERPPADPYRSMALWLGAQSQPDDNARSRLLHDLIATTDVQDEYAQMAREFLLAEDAYTEAPPPDRRGVGWGVAAAVGVIALVIGATALFSPARPDTPAITASAPAGAPTLDAAALPDRSEPLVAESFTARYEDGILQLTALEDRSERVVDSRTGALLTPVAGARFYAVALAFECRSGICDNPPEAALTLRAGTGEGIAVRENATIAGESTLEAVALGRSTRGWVVFELPTLSQAVTLEVLPAATNTDNAPPLVIELP
jgi:hypothetical protein